MAASKPQARTGTQTPRVLEVPWQLGPNQLAKFQTCRAKLSRHRPYAASAILVPYDKYFDNSRLISHLPKMMIYGRNSYPLIAGPWVLGNEAINYFGAWQGAWPHKTATNTPGK